ncbi:tripartite tricarboxylate transporter substrate binding protein [Ramlibacter sp. G-1-2-2]|uniref:Tripartite tricarboxylate transporter substrate binding protein n=1 Tax=Ramlibacter agri TaxID=2728837 RepID=A0A848H3W4_9BURK|nr:tripartite tricarboxylate transporter substrate binding protein [Ramlibacter agri]NML43900.1 tripartite tricarboxylate transporter substrate binding protein [Ramlibacter agri]
MPAQKLTRRAFAAGCAAVLAPAFAQERFPSRTIRLISPAPPGALSDTLPRLLASELGASMHSTVIVENKPGAGGAIGASTVAHAPADGYTLLLGTGGIMDFNPHLLPQVGYDPRKDFTGLALAASTPLYLVVRSDSPYKTFDDLVAAAKAKPGELAHGTLGNGSTVAVACTLLARAKGLQFIEVPFAGYAPGLQELLAGRLAFFMVDGSALSRIEGGSLRALAVTTALRAKRLPAVPTLKELGAAVDLSVWFGLFGPAGLPQAVAQKLSAELKAAIEKPAVRTQLAGFGLEPGSLFGDAFQQYHLAEVARWAGILPALGLKAST